jgi:SARP family transcriptional regulator, regulator of embCAB operon
MHSVRNPLRPDHGRKLQINLFGSTTVVSRKGERIHDVAGVKPRRVLEVLSVNPGVAVGKSQMAEIVWDGKPPPSALASVESYVCVLRRHLGESRGRESAVQTTHAGYSLNPELAVVDVAEARRLLNLARYATNSASLQLVNAVLDIAQGELLAAAETSWALEERTRFESELVAACVNAAHKALELGEGAEAIRLSANAIRRDPLAELAWQTNIRALTRMGRFAEALRAYEQLRGRLRTELGVDPQSGSRLAYDELLVAMRESSRVSAVADLGELGALLGLLRQSLESIPGLRVPTSDAELSKVAVHVRKQMFAT